MGGGCVNNLEVIKGFLFSLVLIFAAYTDIKSRIIPDKVHIAIIIIGLINFSPITSIIGLILTPLPFLIAAILKPGSMGGGDIKLMGSCGFLLGVFNGYVAIFIGLMSAVIISILFRKDKNAGIPLAPFLGIGCFLSYLIY